MVTQLSSPEVSDLSKFTLDEDLNTSIQSILKDQHRSIRELENYIWEEEMA